MKYDEIRELLNSDFERSLFSYCLANLEDSSNKLRFNNFAYGVRELSRHILKTLSPDDEVLNCEWYTNETTQPDGVTRGQRVKYAIQGGLNDKFVNKEIIEISEINELKREIKDSIEILNKHTHVNPSTFDISDVEITKLSNQILSAFQKMAVTIKETRELIISRLEEKIYDGFVEHSIYECFEEIDVLSTHHNIEEIEPSEIGIRRIKSKSLEIHASGTISARLQWGSNSDLKKDLGHEMNTSFPFECAIEAEINKTLKDSEVSISQFSVNTDDWYE